MITVKLYRIYAIAKLLQDKNFPYYTNDPSLAKLNEIMNLSEEILKDYDNEILERYNKTICSKI